jgi:hypothetical protein
MVAKTLDHFGAIHNASNNAGVCGYPTRPVVGCQVKGRAPEELGDKSVTGDKMLLIIMLTVLTTDVTYPPSERCLT